MNCSLFLLILFTFTKAFNIPKNELNDTINNENRRMRHILEILDNLEDQNIETNGHSNDSWISVNSSGSSDIIISESDHEYSENYPSDSENDSLDSRNTMSSIIILRDDDEEDNNSSPSIVNLVDSFNSSHNSPEILDISSSISESNSLELRENIEENENEPQETDNTTLSKINIFQIEPLLVSHINYIKYENEAINEILNGFDNVPSKIPIKHKISKRSLSLSEEMDNLLKSLSNSNAKKSHVEKRILTKPQKLDKSGQNQPRFNNHEQNSVPKFEKNNPVPLIHETYKNVDQILEELKMFDFENMIPDRNFYGFDADLYNRQEIVINEVKAEKSFVLEKQIYEWKSNENHAVGRGEHGITLVSLTENGHIVDNHDFNEYITSIELFNWWNNVEKCKETILLIAQDMKINWFKFSDDNQLTQLWSWTFTETVVDMNIFQLNKDWKLAIVQENHENLRSLCIFGVQMFENYWFEGKYNGHGKTIVFDEGKYLASIQSDRKSIPIYKYDEKTKIYLVVQSFYSANVESVVSFTAGTELFLAIGGDNSAIYQIAEDKFVPKVIHDIQIDHVELWLPITVDDFWDSTVVLFQHKLDHNSHSSSILEALQWNGKGFTILDHSPCISHEEEMFGFSCILDAEGEKGIKGAAIIKSMNNQNNILTASEEYAPVMFEIKLEMVEIPDPYEVEMQQIMNMKNSIEKKILQQQTVLDRAKKILNVGISSNEDNLVADNWKIGELHATTLRLEGNLENFLPINGEVFLGGRSLNNVDFNMDMTELFQQIKQNHEKIARIIHRLENSVTDTDEHYNNLIIRGGITVGGKVKIENANFDYINDVKVNDVLKTAEKIPKDKILKIHGKKMCSYLPNEELTVKRINDVEISNPKSQQNPILIHGDIEMLNRIHVKEDVVLPENGRINNIDFKNDIYVADKKIFSQQPLYFENIVTKNDVKVKDSVNGIDFTENGFKKLSKEYENQYSSEVEIGTLNLKTLKVDKDLRFDTINGRKWIDYINNIVFTNQELIMDELIIEGELSSENGTHFHILNELAFPDDFYQSTENMAVFTASKTFLNEIVVDEIDCDETISDIDPRNLVTLNTRQKLDNFTFLDLTISERMNIDGEIIGKDLDTFLNNPQLTESNIINSNTIFKNLRVEGNVIVENKFNSTNLNNLLEDVILQSDQPIVIDSMKVFEGNIITDKSVFVNSGFINERRLTDLLTIDTEQDIDVETMRGNIKFQNIDVGGTFDSVNISDFMKNSIKLNEDQMILSQITFGHATEESSKDFQLNDEVFDFEAENIEIVNTCNDWDVETDAIDVTEGDFILNQAEFEHLIVDHLTVKGNMNIFDKISGINLEEFDRIRLSKTEDRIITAPAAIGKCTTRNMDFKFINDYSIDDIRTFVNQAKNLEQEILAGNIQIGTLNIKGKLNVDLINGVNLKEIFEEAIWLKDEYEKDIIPGTVTFLDEVYFDEIKIGGNVYGKNFENYLKDIVKKTDYEIYITGEKVFQNGFSVQNYANITRINEIPLINLLTSDTEQIIESDIYVNGKIIVKNLDVKGMVNGVFLKDTLKSFQHVGENKYQFSGDFYMDENSFIENLFVKGFVNNKYNLDQFLQTAIMKNADIYLEKPLVFIGKVYINEILDVKTYYNGIDVRNLKNIVTLDENTFINSHLKFVNPVYIEKSLNVEKNINCNYIQECDVRGWVENFMSSKGKQHVPGKKIFNNIVIKGNMYVDYLNDQDMKKIIYLDENQYFQDSIFVETLYTNSNIIVNNLLNSLLFEELGNLLTFDQNQQIKTPISFHSNVKVKNNLLINNINSFPFDRIVKLDENQLLVGNYHFLGNTHFKNNVNVTGLISNIHLDLWMNNAIFKSKTYLNYNPQIVKGNWNILGTIHFHSNVSGRGTLGNIPITDLQYISLEKNDDYKKRREVYIEKYVELCKSVNEIAKLANNKANFFRNFVEIQKIYIGNSITHQFSHGTHNFIILTNEMSCLSEVWKFNLDIKAFQFLSNFESGCPGKWYSIKQENRIYLVSQSKENCDCKLQETELFSFDGLKLQHVFSLPSLDYIQVSKHQGVFYGIRGITLKKYLIPYITNHEELTISQEVLRLNSENLKFLPYKSVKGVIFTNYEKTILVKLHQNGMQLKNIYFEDETLLTADELVDFTVGLKRKELTAALWNSIKIGNSSFSMIKIYTDIINNEVYQTIPTYKPSSLKILQLDNYQTMLMLVENNERVQIYTYKGFSGFVHLYEMPVKELQQLELFESNNLNMVIATTKESVIIFEIKTYGDKIKINNIPCYL